VHEVEHDEGRFDGSDRQGNDRVEPPRKIDKRSRDGQCRSNQQHQKDRYVNSDWNYVFAH
jgi:hypothetical protein